MRVAKLILVICALLFSHISIVSSQSRYMDVQGILKNIPVKILDGRSITLDKYRQGQPLYLKFWASWCQPCRAQMPHLQKSYEKYGNKIKIIAVNIGINDSLQAIKNTIEEFSLTVPIAVDSTGELANAFNLIGTPYHILINADGKVVFTGHKVSDKLDKTIQLLAASKPVAQPKSFIRKPLLEQPVVDINKYSQTALFFTATWCDYYLKDSRPQMSVSCINGQNMVNTLYKKTPGINWVGIISRLWTGEKELEEYKNKYQITHPLVIDKNNQEYSRYKVKTFPTLILFNHGREVFRTSDFSDSNKISSAIADLNK